MCGARLHTQAVSLPLKMQTPLHPATRSRVAAPHRLQLPAAVAETAVRPLVIIGTGYPDVVKLVDAINREQRRWQLLGFIDDRPECLGNEVMGLKVLGGRSLMQTLRSEGASFFNNVTGQVKNAAAIAELLDQLRCPTPNLVHPAVDLSYVQLGQGCILQQGCALGSRTRIGNYLVTRLNVVISHDVQIEDHVFIGPGTVIGSEAVIERGAFLGAGVTVKTGCRIGAQSVIGAGALVSRDVPAHTTMVGMAARAGPGNGRE